MRRALIIGIDHYAYAPLKGCINDANAIHELLKRNDDGSANFACRLMESSTARITTAALMEEIEQLLRNPADTALLYFAGHGTENLLDGFLVTQDGAKHQEGISFSQVVKLANLSRCKEVVLIVDACHSGHLGSTNASQKIDLREGVAILTATLPYQIAKEKNGQGVFTKMLCEALSGEAADLLGNVTLSRLYSYLDQMLGPWEQRPMLKAHLSRMITLRTCPPGIPLNALIQLKSLFGSAFSHLRLSPAFEPTSDPEDHPKQMIFNRLQKFRSQGLLEPVEYDHLYDTALYSGHCRLTPQGRFFWKLLEKGIL